MADRAGVKILMSISTIVMRRINQPYGGALRNACDHVIVVPGTTSDRIQEVHIKIVHLLIELIEERLFRAV